jgi:hypothetical protein
MEAIMKPLEKFLSDQIRKYAKIMDIHFSQSLVTFYHENKTIQSDTILCIDNKNKKILGWNCDVPSSVNCIRINVLNPKEFEKYTSLRQDECIGRFINIAMKKFEITRTMIRPIFRVFNVNSLPEIRTALENGVNMCGAQKVEYI